MLNVVNGAELIELRVASHDAIHFVIFLKEEFGEVGPILAGDAGD